MRPAWVHKFKANLYKEALHRKEGGREGAESRESKLQSTIIAVIFAEEKISTQRS